jgi:hypothetical protein
MKSFATATGHLKGGLRVNICGAVDSTRYDKAFEVIVAGEHHAFDSFECAIHALALVCPYCRCQVIGHGVEQGGKIFCCVNSTRGDERTRVKDRV